MTVTGLLPPTRDHTGQLRRANRELRTARALLADAERFLHDLPDHQSPRDLLELIRRFNATQGGNS